MGIHTETTRRVVIGGGLASAALALTRRPALGGPFAQAGTLVGDPFTLGVASGDPQPGGFVLWTRLAVEPLAPNGLGGMPSHSVDVAWEVSSDPQFRQVAQSGVVTALPDTAHSVHVEVNGLAPHREYWYRFKVDTWVSPAGRSLTAPDRTTMPASLTMSFVSCSHFEEGWFTAYRRLAEDQPDLVLHLGDYFYGDSQPGRVRTHVGNGQNLPGYRLSYAQYRTDPDLQAAHAVAPWLAVWDDHEVADNYANLIPSRPADLPHFAQRRAEAYQAYYENMPLRRAQIPVGPDMRLFRRVTWGQLATFHMLDTRQYRDDQACGDGFRVGCTAADQPNRTMPGLPEERWLAQGFTASTARWDIIGQQVFFAQQDYAANPKTARLSMDAWDGYTASRGRVMQSWVDAGVRNPVVLTGDIHSHYASDLKLNFDDPHAPVVGSELVTSSISSKGDGADTEAALLAWNPHIKFQNNLRGYVRTTITPTELRADFRVVDRVTVKNQPARTKASFVLADGVRGLQRV